MPVFPLSRDVRLEVKLDTVPLRPALAVLVALPDVSVRLDSALRGAEAPEEPSPATVPAADDDPGVERPCRAWVTEDISCVDVAWALVPAAWATATAWPVSPPGFVVCGGDVNVEKAEAEAELAA